MLAYGTVLVSFWLLAGQTWQLCDFKALHQALQKVSHVGDFDDSETCLERFVTFICIQDYFSRVSTLVDNFTLQSRKDNARQK